MDTCWKAVVSKWMGMVLLFTLVAVPGMAFGQAAPAPAAPMAPMPPQMAMPQPTPAEPAPQFLGMDFTGYIDGGYTSFSTGKGTFNNRAHARTFDWENGVASLQNIDLQLQKTPDNGFGGLIDLSFGKDADTIHSYGMVDKDKGPYFSDMSAASVTNSPNPKTGLTTSSNPDAPAQTYWDVTQLYAYYGMGSLSLTLGKFVTHAGQEVIKSRDDTNFSRSILFGFAIPFTHTGVRATYKAADTLTLILGANEGWDNITSKNGGMTGEFDWEWSPSKAFSFFGTYLNGTERVFNYPSTAGAFIQPSGQTALTCHTTADFTGPCAGFFNYEDSDKGTRTLLDLVLTYNATDALSFVLNYDNGTQASVPDFFCNHAAPCSTVTAAWSGWALYANYGINDNWRVSARTESFSDPNSFRTGVAEADVSPAQGFPAACTASAPLCGKAKDKGPTWNESTLTVAYMGIKKVELRGEFRADSADQKIFSNAAGDEQISSMSSVALEALYKF
jgi:hypothetical protein